MNNIEALKAAAGKVAEKVSTFGKPEDHFRKTSTIASTLLGRHISEYEIAIILAAGKLAATNVTRADPRHYVSAINLIAIATQFATGADTAAQEAEEAMRIEAQRAAEEAAKRPSWAEVEREVADKAQRQRPTAEISTTSIADLADVRLIAAQDEAEKERQEAKILATRLSSEYHERAQ